MSDSCNAFYLTSTKQLFSSLLGALPRIGLCFLLLASPAAIATVLLEMNIDEIANQAELIFEGTVIESKADPDSAGSISTYITFSVSDLIKGDYDQTTIELKFLGGSLNGRTVAVAGSRLPQTGETGIYFVESIVDDLINPLLGWSQGYFLVQTDDNGEERILTSNYEPVNDIQSARQVPAAIRKPLTIVSEDTSNASGVVIDEDLTNTQQALSVDEFKTRIRNLIEN